MKHVNISSAMWTREGSSNSIAAEYVMIDIQTKHYFDSTLQQIKALILHPQERIVVAMRKICQIQRMGKCSMFVQLKS